MAGLEGWDDIKESLPSPSRRGTSRAAQKEAKASLNILLWNIHGSTSEGMASARTMLLKAVVKKSNPDVLLLQEVVAESTITKLITYANENMQREYDYKKIQSEAAVIYDTKIVMLVSSINIEAVIGHEKIFSGESSPSQTTRRQERSPDQEYYGSRACAIKLRHIQTGIEFVVVSFHNASTRRGGKKENIISYAKGFLKLVCLLETRENLPAVAGGDFNCDRSKLLLVAEENRLGIPDYDSSDRRKGKEKIDLFIIKDPSTSVSESSKTGVYVVLSHAEAKQFLQYLQDKPSTTSQISVELSQVEVHEALPLVDHTSAEADMHFLGKGTLRYLKDKAPVKKSGERFTLEEYSDVTNHDPTHLAVTFSYIPPP